MGTNQLLSVPFAQYANRSANGISKADSAKLAGIAAGAEVNVNADWNAVSGDAQILNKPTIPTYDGSETKVTGSANVTVTGTGTTTTPYVIATSANPTMHSIGESYGGGIVFYVYDGGLHGLIAAKADLLEGQYFNWFYVDDCGDGCTTYMSTGAMGDGLGAGKMNTSLIVAAQMSFNLNFSVTQPLDFAAEACADYTDGDITFGDWYLPSLYELNLLYLSLEKTQEFLNLSQGEGAYYWSSTEIDSQYANLFYFYDGTQDWDSKEYGYLVRPIRAF